ncbi:hypothetical protein F4819DRAFT_490053 [Hypoxylon fuscum]|nr:hypothetical protein F4819DRAFT_490053 [Hypoxylon fuscum]
MAEASAPAPASGESHPLSSFGVELEFVVAVKDRDKFFNVPRRWRTATSQPINVPPREERHALGLTIEHFIEGPLAATIQSAANAHRGDRVAADTEDIESYHLYDYVDWVVKEDISVFIDGAEFGDDQDAKKYYWKDVEVTSPVLYATDKSFAEVHHVVQALQDNYWIVTPKSSGLHVHYGRGKEWIPFRDLRKIAAFLYAADPTLAQMHPAERLNVRTISMHCPSNSLYSSISHGSSERLAREHLGNNTVEAPPDPLNMGAVSRLPLTRNSRKQRGEGLTTLFQRGTLEGYIFNVHIFRQTQPEWLEGGPMTVTNPVPYTDRLPGSGPDEPVETLVGARELLSTINAPTISALMEAGLLSRSAYNFQAYNNDEYGRATSGKRTIEFRQAAGTVEPDEVVAHCKIACRLADFASSLSTAELYMMIVDLVECEEHPEWYDVFDLLYDLGLVKEALVIQRQIAQRRGIQIVGQSGGRNIFMPT